MNSGSVKKRLEANPDYFEKRKNATPIRRIGDPEEIAATALFIVSPENDFMSGAVVSIDGGIT